MSDFRASILAQLNLSQIPEDIKKIENQKIVLKNVTINAKEISSAIQKELNNAKFSPNVSNIMNQMRQQGNAGGKQFVNSFVSELNKIDLVNGGLGNVKNMLQGAGFNKQSIETVTKDLGKMSLAIEKIKTTMSQNGNIRMNITGVDELGRSVNILREYDSETGRVVNVTKTFTQSFKASVSELKEMSKLNLGIKTGDFETKLNSIKTQSGQLSNITTQTKNNIEQLNALFNTMNNPNASMDKRVEAYREFNSLLPIIRGQLNTVESAEKQAAAQAKELSNQNQQTIKDFQTISKSDILSNKITAWMNANTEAAKRYGEQLEIIKSQLKNNKDPTLLNKLSLEFSKIQSEAKAAGLLVNSFTKSIKDTVLQVLGLSSSIAVFNKAIQALNEMVSNVREIDTAMTGLYRVTNLSASQYENLYDKMTVSAKKYGATLAEIINSTASWVRLGFNADTAERLSEITAMYQHVTDLDESTAVKNLVTAYKGFEQSLLKMSGGNQVEAFTTIADIYDKLGNEFAESASEVGDGIARSASVLQQAGATIQESAGMFTGIQEVLQSSESSGTALKILALRIRGMKGDLEALGEEVDENVESISKMQTQILNFTNGKVNIFDNEGNFRNIYDIMKDISKVYDELTATDRSDLLETIAGKNRANAVQALINNWEQVEKATEAAYNSAGTAAKEQNIYMNSIEGRLNSLEASWQNLSNTIINSDLLKGGISFLTELTSGIDEIIDKAGTLPTLLTVATAALSFKNIGTGKMFPVNSEYADNSRVLFKYKIFRLYLMKYINVKRI